ncbi:hypothetical protein EVAR_87933_1 [Eumeta japonica]|uniref:Uncharacterized protein n=1 Tax=Eumeta variegata TaxID=151549 RepID=A0A4C1WTW8_EUMVA|nr:hypothetical protein EVAR_87933_1 [Eumeta japonica]
MEPFRPTPLSLSILMLIKHSRLRRNSLPSTAQNYHRTGAISKCFFISITNHAPKLRCESFMASPADVVLHFLVGDLPYSFKPGNCASVDDKPPRRRSGAAAAGNSDSRLAPNSPVPEYGYREV